MFFYFPLSCTFVFECILLKREIYFEQFDLPQFFEITIMLGKIYIIEIKIRTVKAASCNVQLYLV
jgi:hypothetical protein